MDRIDILIWSLGFGFTILFSALIFLWKSLKYEIDATKAELKHEIDASKVELKLEIKEVRDDLKKLTQQVSDVDKRVYGIERVLEMKDCCVLKSDERHKKAE